MDIIHSLDSGADFEGEAGYSLFMIGGRFRAQGVVVGVLASLLAITGCTGSSKDPAPTPTTTISPSSTPTPSVTVTPPVAPEAVRSAKGAEEFVRYFWDVYNYSYATRDSSLLLAISDTKCVFCMDTAARIETLVTSNQHVTGARVEVVVAVAPPSDPAAGLIVATTLNERPGSILAGDGSIVKKQPGFRNMQSEISLSWQKTGWEVRDLANNEETGTPWA